MKKCRFHLHVAGALTVLILSHGQVRPADIPVITEIRPNGTNLVVVAEVPTGICAVTLESRTRLGEGTWQPRAIARPEAGSTQVTFRLNPSEAAELLRVRAATSEPLPASFYSGATSFANQATTTGSGSGPPIFTFDGNGGPATGVPGTGTPPPTAARDVVESDIYKLRNHTLYFFNQYRGLQVIDLSHPDTPRIAGTLPLPAAGEQMYLLGDRHVVLLARQDCGYGSAGGSQVLIVADNGGTPQIVARLPVAGTIQESRLVGTALYVATQTYRSVAASAGTIWEWGSQVVAFDLSNPEAPVERNTLWFSGWGNVVSATDTFLFVATQDPGNWWQSLLNIIDITNPDGTMSTYDSIQTAGRIQDKFKINYANAVLTTISEDWRTRVVTTLETFRLPDPRSMAPFGVVKLGQLLLGAGEQLHATRFDGQLVYVVTFFRIDPLWVVDLSDPSNPRIAGELQVPGWSTYIEPLGDRLVALGVETNRVTVSLFDVHDPGKPALLSKVWLGEQYSWSEANYDEKAFTVLPGAGLILVPYSGSSTNGYSSQVQLIDLGRDTLAARGIIEHRLPARRATLLDERIVSFSNWELFTVDATDRDHPQVRGRLDLAWSVDRVFIQGQFLLEISAGGWGYDSSPTLRVVEAADPNHLLTLVPLPNLQVIGASVSNGKLYVAQGQSLWYPYVPLRVDRDGVVVPKHSFVLSIFGLDQLPAVSLLGQVQTNLTELGWSSSLQPLWVRPDLLVWAGGGNSFWWWGPRPIPLPLGPVAVTDGFGWPYWGDSGGQFIAFDVSNSTAPQFLSEVNLGGSTSSWWSFSKAFTANGLVYVSHNESQFFPDTTITNTTSSGDSTDPIFTLNGPTPGAGTVIIWPIGAWIQRSFLDVIDYADAQHPTIRKPVNIPGTLSGISQGGALLYTVGTHLSSNSVTIWNEYLDASAYDGVEAHLIDSLPLSPSWPHPVLILGTNVLVGEPHRGTNAWFDAGFLQTWTLSPSGKFAKLGELALNLPAQLLINFGDALVTQQTDNNILLLDAYNAAALRQLASGRPTGCLWPDLNNSDATLVDGLWTPLGAYGVWNLTSP